MASQSLDIAASFLMPAPHTHFHHWNVVDSNKGDIAIRHAVMDQLRSAFAPVPLEFDEIQWGELDIPRARDIDDRCDMFVVAGSGYLFPSRGNFPSRFFDDIEALKRIRIPKIAYGIGWNTILGEGAPLQASSAVALRAFVDAVDAVSVRDRNAQQAILDNTSRNVPITGDPALYLGDPVAGSRNRRMGGRLRIGFNAAYHGPISARNLERNIDKLAALLKQLSEQYDAELHYVCHAGAERAVWWLLRARGVRLHWHDVAVADLPSLYRTMDFQISQMMHSAILALGAGVPTIAMAYDEKTIALFELLNLPHWCVPIDDWELRDVVHRFEQLLAGENEIRRKIREEVTHWHRASIDFLNSAKSDSMRRLAPDTPGG